MEVAQLRIMGRATQGVRLINLRDNDAIASVAMVASDRTEGPLMDGVGDDPDMETDENEQIGTEEVI